MPATALWLASAEALLNRNIVASTTAMSVGKRLDGTSLSVEIEGIANIRAAMHGGTLALRNGAEIEPSSLAADARITGSVPALLQMFRSDGRPGASRGHNARSTVQISGDAEIANLYRELFLAARPDLEEELSRFIGDLPARRVSRLAAGFAAWAQRTRRTAFENIGEYLQEESRDLVNDTELAEFLQGVDSVRETTDRVAARLSRLELLAKGGG